MSLFLLLPASMGRAWPELAKDGMIAGLSAWENCYTSFLSEQSRGPADFAAASRNQRPAVRRIAQGPDWSINEYVCCAGPRDRPFEERHQGATIAAVVEGSFSYRTVTGRALMYPGAFLLGNPGTCFECGHDHSTGDRCISIHLAADFFAEISANAAGSGRFTFPSAMLPVSRQLAAALAETVRTAYGTSSLSADELVIAVAEAAIAATSGQSPNQARTSPRDERRIAAAIRHIEAHSAADLGLDELAVLAGMSKYHFLRTFRRMVRVTPYQFLLSVRMRRAAVCLAGTSESVASIAFAAGFGDLSTFNHRFRDLFGMSPLAYRRRAPARPPLLSSPK